MGSSLRNPSEPIVPTALRDGCGRSDEANFAVDHGRHHAGVEASVELTNQAPVARSHSKLDRISGSVQLAGFVCGDLKFALLKSRIEEILYDRSGRGVAVNC